MTPAELRESMTRQNLSTQDLARLVYVENSAVSRWRMGVHKVPGGVQAFLELREGPTPTQAPIVALRRSSGPQSTVNLRFRKRN